MADHYVELNYEPNSFTATPNPLAVRKGQTISFRLGVGPSDGKIRVTFQHPELYSAPYFNDGDGDVTVIGQPIRSTYDCELLVNGQPLAQSGQGAGGEIIPAGS